MENKENYIRKDIVKSVEEAIVEIFNCNNRSSDLSVVDVIEAAKELHNLNKAEEAELYLFVKYTQMRFIRFFNVLLFFLVWRNMVQIKKATNYIAYGTEHRKGKISKLLDLITNIHNEEAEARKAKRAKRQAEREMEKKEHEEIN